MTVKENLCRLAKRVTPNIDQLPLKVHMFLYFGGAVGVMPFSSVLAKQLGISATLVGIANTTLLFASIITKFLIGSLTDKVQRLKIVLIVVIFLQGLFHFLIIVVPRIEPLEVNIPISFKPCNTSNDTLNFCISTNALSRECKDDALIGCRLSCTNSADHSTSNGGRSFQLDLNLTCSPADDTNDGCTHPALNGAEMWYDVCERKHQKCVVTCPAKIQPSAVLTSSFWMFCIFRVLGGIAFGVGVSLTDTAAYAILKERKQDYGKQRLWGTIGWGGLAPLVGHLNELATAGSSYVDYRPGFYLLATLVVLDICGAFFLDVPRSPTSKQLLKDVGQVFVKTRALFFTFSVFNMGLLMGFVWSYGLWYLQDLGASPSLLGANLAVQCFGGEVPVLFFSGWIIKRIGYGNAVSLSIAGLALRLGVYSFGTDVWAMLPVEVTHGLCFGLFYAAMTSFASMVALPGTEATMQGILGGTFEGLGLAVGTLIAGSLYNVVGKRQTCFIYFVYCLVFLVFHIVVDRVLARIEDGDEPTLKNSKAPAVDGEHDPVLAVEPPETKATHRVETLENVC